MKRQLFQRHLYGLPINNQQQHPNLPLYDAHIESILEVQNKPRILGDVFSVMLHMILSLQWEGACHKTSSILYVIYTELGFEVDLCMGEVQIDHRYFDHSWIQLGGLVLDASLLNPLNKNLNLSPVFMNINLESLSETSLKYGNPSTIGLSEFTKIIYHRPFHKYMKPSPFGKGKWRYVEAISNALDLHIDIASLPEKYKNTHRILVCED